MHATISDQPLDSNRVAMMVSDDRSGAVVTFTGVVRDHDANRAVAAIDYSAHPSADRILHTLVAQCCVREGVHGAAAEHRVGHVGIGEVAMVVAVSAEHRGQAFAATSDLVDAIKANVPIWKCQWFTDGSHEWTGLPESTKDGEQQ